jgi:hypothetical protein
VDTRLGVPLSFLGVFLEVCKKAYNFGRHTILAQPICYIRASLLQIVSIYSSIAQRTSKSRFIFIYCNCVLELREALWAQQMTTDSEVAFERLIHNLSITFWDKWTLQYSQRSSLGFCVLNSRSLVSDSCSEKWAPGMYHGCIAVAIASRAGKFRRTFSLCSQDWLDTWSPLTPTVQRIDTAPSRASENSRTLSLTLVSGRFKSFLERRKHIESRRRRRLSDLAPVLFMRAWMTFFPEGGCSIKLRNAQEETREPRSSNLFCTGVPVKHQRSLLSSLAAVWYNFLIEPQRIVWTASEPDIGGLAVCERGE